MVCLRGFLLSFHYLRTGGLMSNSPTWEQRSPWSQNVPLDAAVRGFHSCLLHVPALLFLLSAIYWPLLPLLTKHKTNTTSTIEPYFTRCGFFFRSYKSDHVNRKIIRQIWSQMDMVRDMFYSVWQVWWFWPITNKARKSDRNTVQLKRGILRTF